MEMIYLIGLLAEYFNPVLLSAGNSGGEINKTGYIILIIVLFFGGTIAAGLVTFFIVRLRINKQAKKQDEKKENKENRKSDIQV